MQKIPDNIYLWIMASRPRTLTAGMSPVILGAAIAYDTGFRFWVTLAALFSCLLLQVGTNLANDYFDAKSGVDGENRLGPVRVTQQGLIAPASVRRAFILCFGAAVVLGIPLVLVGGLPILAIGILSVLFAYLYTGGPFPLAYYGMGEILAFIFYGIVATGGVFYLNTQSITIDALTAGAGLGFIAALLMGVNNLRDIDTDRSAGKNTVPVLLGERRARGFVFSLLIGALCVPLIYALLNPGQPLVVLASAAVIPFYKHFRSILSADIDAGFNRILAATGKFLFVYAILFSAGVLVSMGG
jgi:1,4-dihydroxy-2-naphthoate polyprenyltransferase